MKLSSSTGTCYTGTSTSSNMTQISLCDAGLEARHNLYVFESFVINKLVPVPEVSKKKYQYRRVTMFLRIEMILNAKSLRIVEEN